MTMEIPSAPKVYTTVYDNFRGVDYTNDQTNIWRRRSPTGYNMLPDEAGRPFKRTGWEVAISTDEITALIGGDYAIQKCFYFELGGVDHIVIFCDVALLLYADGELSLLSRDSSCCASYERAFFFEGGGKSAFYIYGDSRAWVYDGTFSECQYYDGKTNEIGYVYIPRIFFSADPSTATGTDGESLNLIGNRAAVEYTSNDMFRYYTTSETIMVVVNKDNFISQVSTRGEYRIVYTNSAWTLNGTTITDDYGITVDGTPEENDEIVVEYKYGVLLPVNVALDMINDVQVFVSVGTQFDKELEVTELTLSATSCVLHTDSESKPDSDRRAWIEFNKQYNALVDGEDAIRVVFPVVDVTVTNYENTPVGGNIGTAELIT